MSQQTLTQQQLDEQQTRLNQQTSERQQALAAGKREFAKAINKRLAGAPINSTNVGEVALVVIAVLDELGIKHGAK